MTNVLQHTFERNSLVEQHIRDAQRCNDWPEDELHEVVLDPEEVTVEGTPVGIRWLYDTLQQLARDWRQEGEQWDADAAEAMATELWEAADGDLPDQQRPRKIPDGGRPAFIDPQTDWVECYICGQHIEDMSRVEGLDVSQDDEYYPDMKPVCRTHKDDSDGDGV